MRFMILRKADKGTEAGVMPSEELMAAMGKYVEEMVSTGIMLAGEGLQPTSKGARIKFSGGNPTVTDGPSTETKELVAGAEAPTHLFPAMRGKGSWNWMP